MLFVKDPLNNEWNSKLDRISMMFASMDKESRYWTPGDSGRRVAQCCDGKVLVPPGGIPALVIVHDRGDYPTMKNHPRKVYLCGAGEGTVLPSYPLDDIDRHSLESSAEFDTVIGGSLQDGWEDALERASGMVSDNRRVAVAVTNSGANIGRIRDTILEKGGKPTVLIRPELPVVAALYRSCANIVHLGHCSRGYLHTLARYHSGMHGKSLVERVPGESFEFCTPQNFLAVL